MEKFTTSKGVVVEFLAIPPRMLQRFDALNPSPDPPTYPVTLATGATQQIPLDEESLRKKPEQFTEEQHRAYAAYQAKLNELTEKFIKFFCLRGIRVEADMATWEEEQTFIGLPIPENKAEAKYEWLVTAVLGTVEDYKAIVLGILQASGVPDHLLTQVADQFRGDLQDHTAESDRNTGQPVEGQPEVSGSGSSDPQRDPAASIRPAAPAAEGRDHPVLENKGHDGRHQRARARR